MRRTLVGVVAVTAAVAGAAAGEVGSLIAQDRPAAQTRSTEVDLARDRLVDLSHSFNSRTIYWPTATRFTLKEVAHGETEGGWHYSANDFSAAEHGGTHLDAPIHFARRGQSTEEVSLRRLVGPAVVVDVRGQAREDRDHLVGVADLRAWERENGRLARRTIVLLRTGWDRFWPDAERYLGTAERGAAAVPKLHFPGLSQAGARWLVRQRGVRAVGIDTASIDRGQSTRFEAHRVLAAAQVPVFENVANLDELPVEGAQVVALPMKIEGGSGGPLRIMGVVRRRG
jgi:kynurenine formamidase